jgi:GT2 family glycosyltransferase
VRQGLGAFDVIGLAGNRRRVPRQPGWLFLDERLTPDNRENLSGAVGHGRGLPLDTIDVFGPSGQPVKLLDGLFLAVGSETLRAKSIRFDERFDFHFYDVDFCRQAENAGLRMGTWPISVVHESSGGFISDGWRRGYESYLDKWGE